MNDAAERRRVRVIVRGRVQGVAFRAATADAARRAGVAGWVRNRGDGSVEAVFEGDGDRVASLLAFVHRGPPLARVDALETHPEDPCGEVEFRVRF